MIIWLALLIPIITTIILYSVPTLRVQVALWEPLTLFGVTIGMIFLFKFIGINSLTNDTERLVDYVVAVEHHEYWNEWISQTCEDCTTDDDGNETCTSYDCSYQEEYSPYTTIFTKTGRRFRIYEGQDYRWGHKNDKPLKYLELKKKFNTKVSTDKSNRRHLDDDYGDGFRGDVHTVYFNGDFSKIEYTIWEQTYENRVQASNSIERFYPVDSSEIKQYSLYEYPKIYSLYKSNSIIGETNILDEYVNNKNALIGSDKQLKVYYLIYKNQPHKAALLQRQHWAGGNKNEVVICIGIDNDRNIKWSNVFSWSEKSLFKVEIRNHINQQKKLDNNTFKNIIDFSFNNLEKNYVRRKFADFSYIDIEPPLWSIITTFCVSFVLCVALSFFIVLNPFN